MILLIKKKIFFTIKKHLNILRITIIINTTTIETINSNLKEMRETIIKDMEEDNFKITISKDDMIIKINSLETTIGEETIDPTKIIIKSVGKMMMFIM